MPASTASAEAIDTFLAEHGDWAVEDGALHRTFTFRTFREAFGFMAEIALAAERANHHPEWGNVYNTVTVRLVTHDAGGITEKDLDLAGKMDTAAARR